MAGIWEVDGNLSWRQKLQPASFRGVVFHVEVGGQASGRRVAEHEFPKRNVPFGEDMGRKARRYAIQGYIVVGPQSFAGASGGQQWGAVGSDYIPHRDALIRALEADGPGELIHPTLGSVGQVLCEVYNMTESRQKGGFVTFDMMFVEAGSPVVTDATASNSGQVGLSSVIAGQTVATSLDANLAATGHASITWEPLTATPLPWPS